MIRGYEYSFPFLEDSCNLTIQDKRICPLYKHMIHTEFPSLILIGIPFVVVPFPMFDLQYTLSGITRIPGEMGMTSSLRAHLHGYTATHVQYFLKTLDKTITLPSREDMNAETDHDFQERLAKKMPPRYAHKLGDLQWEYFEDLINGMALQPIPSYTISVTDHAQRMLSSSESSWLQIQWFWSIGANDGLKVKASAWTPLWKLSELRALSTTANTTRKECHQE
uniref:Uncharacterized protein n=1 Tax=Timema cristinae TaxID=61476 RepID=A0A7R9CHY8_TIMCR|nr:unnamed protein product [Timema cristinae]